jgi:acetoin utilization deacetylase AcuC-like enzyme
MITLWTHKGYAAPIGEHVMPMEKFRLIAEMTAELRGVEHKKPEPADDEALLRVHTEHYIEAIRTGHPRPLAESQKFPWSPELFESVALTSGGCIAAGRSAVETGISGNLASGFHHAHADHGEGFCTFNGLVVAAEQLRAEDLISRAAVLDLDLHYGNGTAALAAERPWFFALSIYGSDYSENRAYDDVSKVRHMDGANHQSAAVPNGASGPEYMEIVESMLPRLVNHLPDIVFYQAGADPYKEDPYSPLNLSESDLMERDRFVFQYFKERGIPVAWVLAGGYTRPLDATLRIHFNTALACEEVYGE